MSKKSGSNKRKLQRDVEFLNEVVEHNGRAMGDGPKKKKWTRHDIKTNVKPLKPTQEDMFEAYFRGDDLAAYGSAGTGKAQPMSAKILTPEGWTTMSDITVGTHIITPKGTTTTVTRIFPQGLKDIFTITFHDGSQTQCCAEHLWKCWYTKQLGQPPKQYVIQTFEIMELLKQGISVRIPVITPTNISDVEVPLDPYSVGGMLGDDVEGEGNLTFIPNIYMQSSPAQRWELLQGLMDRDGIVNQPFEGSQEISLCVTNHEIAVQVQELVWSLGGTCAVTEQRKSQDSVTYTLQLMHSTPTKFFKLSEKQELCSSVDGVVLRRAIRNIELSSHEEAQCITVDDDDHLYITDDYIVTHNTFLALYLGMLDVLEKRDQRSRIIIVRSAVPTRDQGFLPGTLEEKQMHYENPYRDIFAELFHKYSTYDDLKAAGIVEFVTTTFVRGLTWDNAVVIIDEGQNMTWHEINSIMTRIGENTRIIFTGDLIQTDLNRKSSDQTGMNEFLTVVERMHGFSLLKFTTADIVRSGFVKHWIETCEELGVGG